ncbi:MAG: NAD-dependent epimerase/dehydratase family protein [Chloroflexi bacterium]|nr:NAD-dependent epimerase/dehydratase family protein [Chloroflexota bacterium]
MKHVLVTGGTGFLGRHLVAHLRRTEPETRLRLLCRESTPADDDPAVEVVRGNVADAASVFRAMDGVDQVYHLAGPVSRRRSDRQDFFSTHVEGARSVCAAAARYRPERLVFVSTSGTIAVSRRPVLHNEGAAYPYTLVSRWPYYVSKIFAEKLVLQATAEHDLPTVVVNPTLVLGPCGGPSSTNASIMPFLDGRLPFVPRGGLSFVDVRDVAAILPVAAARGRAGQRYLLTTANVSFRELTSRLAEIEGRPARNLPGLPTPLVQDAAGVLRLLPLAAQRALLDPAGLEMSTCFWYADASKARTELGFAPRNPSETLAAAVNDLQRAEVGQ